MPEPSADGSWILAINLAPKESASSSVDFCGFSFGLLHIFSFYFLTLTTEIVLII